MDQTKTSRYTENRRSSKMDSAILGCSSHIGVCSCVSCFVLFCSDVVAVVVFRLQLVIRCKKQGGVKS